MSKKYKYASYFVYGKLSDNKILAWFLWHFYKVYTIEKDINGIKYLIEYVRSPFWAYEKPSIRLFIKDKLCTWHGQVWEIFPQGGRCGFGCNCIKALFPKKNMQNFLDKESGYVYNACYNKRSEDEN